MEQFIWNENKWNLNHKFKIVYVASKPINEVFMNLSETIRGRGESRKDSFPKIGDIRQEYIVTCKSLTKDTRSMNTFVK